MIFVQLLLIFKIKYSTLFYNLRLNINRTNISQKWECILAVSYNVKLYDVACDIAIKPVVVSRYYKH